MIKAIIFDMNGVIIDDESLQEKAFKDVLAGRGVNLNHADYYKYCIGLTDRQCIINFVKIYNINNVDKENLLFKKRKKYLEIISGNMKSFPGVRELVIKLSERYKLAVSSSSRREEVKMIIKNFGLAKYFLAIISGSDIKNHKPHPEPYLVAAKKLGFPVSECLAIEDTPVGISSAKAAGMKCVAVLTTNKRSDLKEADYVAKNFQEIEKIINNINKKYVRRKK